MATQGSSSHTEWPSAPEPFASTAACNPLADTSRNICTTIVMPAAEKTASKSELYLESRSRISTLIGILSSSSSQARLRSDSRA